MTGDRDYALPSNLIQIRWPLIDETNGQYISEYPGGYDQIVIDQIFPDNYHGLPHLGAIRTTDGQLYVDFIPQSAENGRVYTLRYDKDLSLSTATDTFPFDDVVFRALVPAVAEMWKRDKRAQEYSPRAYNKYMAQAVRYLSKEQEDDTWLPTTMSS